MLSCLNQRLSHTKKNKKLLLCVCVMLGLRLVKSYFLHIVRWMPTDANAFIYIYVSSFVRF